MYRISDYAKGYQAALLDIAQKRVDNGDPGVLDWLQDNLPPSAVRQDLVRVSAQRNGE